MNSELFSRFPGSARSGYRKDLRHPVVAGSGDQAKRLRVFEETLLQEWGLLNVVPLSNRDCPNQMEQKSLEDGRKCYSAGPTNSSHNFPKISNQYLKSKSAYGSRNAANNSSHHKCSYYKSRVNVAGKSGSPASFVSYSSRASAPSKVSLEVVGHHQKNPPKKTHHLTRHDREMMDVQEMLKLDLYDDDLDINQWTHHDADDADDISHNQLRAPTVLNNQQAPCNTPASTFQPFKVKRTVAKCDVVDFSNSTKFSKPYKNMQLKSAMDSTRNTAKPAPNSSSTIDCGNSPVLHNAFVGEIPFNESYGQQMTRASDSKINTSTSRTPRGQSEKFRIPQHWWSSHNSDPRKFGIYQQNRMEEGGRGHDRSGQKYVTLAVARSKTASTYRNSCAFSKDRNTQSKFLRCEDDVFDPRVDDESEMWPRTHQSYKDFMDQKMKVENELNKYSELKSNEDVTSGAKSQKTCGSLDSGIDEDQTTAGQKSQTEQKAAIVKNQGASSYTTVDKKTGKDGQKTICSQTGTAHDNPQMHVQTQRLCWIST